jgi:hypothetical protein
MHIGIISLHAIVAYDGVVAFSSLSSITRVATQDLNIHSSFLVHSAKSKGFEEEDDDDEISPDCDEEDWRAFRAKLVMSEASASSAKSSSGGLIMDDDEDLDGIGALFAKPETTVASSQPSFVLPPGFTPLDPSQVGSW